MKKHLLSFFVHVAACCFLIDALQAQPSVTSSNGVLGYNLNSYGRLRVSKAPYSHSAREVDRMSFIAALSPENVFDYNEDADTTNILAQRATFPGADSAFICVTDNGYSGKPPKISVRHTLLAWQNTRYIIIRYCVRNDTTVNLPLYLSAAVLTRPSATYGGETIAYNSEKQTTYYFRTGETPHWGVRLLNKPTYSVRIRDWDKYSSDPNSDVAPDSVRYNMSATTGFDAPITVGPNSGIFHVNAGLHNMAPNDTAVVYYAVAFGNSLDEMLAASDAAQARYNLLTSVADKAPTVPNRFALQQNYPNPFNPTTHISFTLDQRSFVSLKVYDVSGREVRTLVQGTLPAGPHVVPFEATGLTSGVYFYTLRANGLAATRKMLLIQ